MDTPTWVRTAVSGEQVAWNLIYHHFYPYLYSLSLKICGNTPAAEDAVQDTFLIAYTKLHQLKDPDSFLPWLKRILSNCCYHEIRKEKHNSIEPLQFNDHALEDSINLHFENLAQRDQLFQSLSSLQEKLRVTIMLRYLSDFNSYQQISDILSVPIGTVRRRLFDARKKITEQWDLYEDACPTEFKNAERWNSFYQETFDNLYTDKTYLTAFIKHFNEEAKIVLGRNKVLYGSTTLEDGFIEDINHGSHANLHDTISSGNISVIKTSNTNSDQYPDHCPPGAVLVILREKEKASMIHFHYTQRST